MARGHAGDAMDVGEAMIVAGIGARRGVATSEVVALIERAVREAHIARSQLAAIATAQAKVNEPGIVEAAQSFNLQLLSIPIEAMRREDGGATQSKTSQRLFGVSSVSEAAALAAAGPGSKLILPRINSARVTCALAAGVEP